MLVGRITMRNNILSLTFGLRSQPPPPVLVSIVSLPPNCLLTPPCQSTLDPISDITFKFIFNFHSVHILAVKKSLSRFSLQQTNPTSLVYYGRL